ncbi:DNA polymerase III subunit gamma/tau [Thermaurantiacus sp.]
MSLFPDTNQKGPYRVLARKYRPAGFQALIGQDAMVQTLANALRTNRLAQAWLLTGVRGVGKTSTARIIARALNCIGPDGTGGPTVEPCGQCSHCLQIGAGEHLDVIEMDAASNTGVDDVREIIEAVRYASASARYKVYIIDEVHMLSKPAFNALLKTLEEPPAHVKFVLATTEVDKVPATILSRCQRFDLKRVPVALLEAHFARIATAEGVEAEAEALTLVARAAEGSVRDGLSILDQAIAMGGGRVTADAVRDMLGLADRGQTVRLFAALVGGDPKAVLAELEASWAAGVEPAAVMRGLLDIVHLLTSARMTGAIDAGLGEQDAATLAGLLPGLDFPRLHRLWQLLLKGHEEVIRAPHPLDAADMACLRIVHAAGLPSPEDLMAMLADGRPLPAARAAPQPAPAGATDSQGAGAEAARPALPADYPAIVRLFEARREPLLARLLHDNVAALSCAPPRLVLRRTGHLPAEFARAIRARLEEWTATTWEIDLKDGEGEGASLRERAEAEARKARDLALADPAVKGLMEAFPGSELVEVTPEENAA